MVGTYTAWIPISFNLLKILCMHADQHLKIDRSGHHFPTSRMLGYEHYGSQG